MTKKVNKTGSKRPRWVAIGFLSGFSGGGPGDDDGDAWGLVTYEGGDPDSVTKAFLHQEDTELPSHYGILNAEEAASLGRALIKVAKSKKSDYTLEESE